MPNGNGLNNLYIPYQAGDNGTRPLPSGANFWSGPGVTLDPTNGAVDQSTYIPNNQPCGILVQVQNKSQVAYQLITVEVWVCNPATLVGPESGLPIASGSSTTSMTGQVLNPSGMQFIVPVAGFQPYPGLTKSPGDHVCLIANCYGTTADNQTDGQSLIGSTTANFVSLVQTDGHVAQHNIFAQQTQGGQNKLSFGFNAATAQDQGHEDVTLEILHQPAATGLTAGDLAFLHNGPFKHLPLHPGTHSVKDYLIHGCHGGPTKRGTVRIHAKHPVPLQLEIELDHHETKGAVQSFDVIQKGANGQVQGGIRLLAVVAH
ncbi:MAG TPA: hypothetical protein VFF52_26420 [Isosphaeraceae bacterium]|nr:hypothetical protein [Isosphaeraceae bacterium]